MVTKWRMNIKNEDVIVCHDIADARGIAFINAYI